MPLKPDERERYGRHLILPEIGEAGQEKLRDARALVIGAGGLGSAICLYLGAAGIGKLGIIDGDTVEASNLQRQVIHDTGSIGTPKPLSAKARIEAINTHVSVEPYLDWLKAENALSLFKNYDVILDATDNYPCRYLASDAARLLKKPLVYGAIHGFEGQVSVFLGDSGPCYRCLYPEAPPKAFQQTAIGVLGTVPGIIGLIQATEAIKLVLGKGKTLAGQLLICNLLDVRFQKVRITQDPACALCGKSPSIREPGGSATHSQGRASQ